ncbi:sensor histidine kinase [Xylanimonas ulmi]|uniref:Signal transduction histidine kinase n=1 Tax=Xylanimonas ulmi TaxID=228973 RepID=A0A4Q7M549_9MICO|nr:histidine kinase [Xylanibacterium ulmi]RZS63086.1 signal transduction histidine kinase [Xylanibacterium ulmi]
MASSEATTSYAVGGVVRALCSIRLLVLALAGVEALLTPGGAALALVALGATPFSFVPALNWHTRGPRYFRHGVLLSADLAATVVVLASLGVAPLMAAYGAASVALWAVTTPTRVVSAMSVPVAALLVPWRSLTQGWASALSAVITVGAVVGMTWSGRAVGDSVRRQQRLASDLARQRARRCAAETRLSIARDLHDTVAGDLAGLRLLAGGLRARVEADGFDGETAALARQLESCVQAAHGHTRRALDGLRAEADPRAQVASIVERWASLTDVAARVRLSGAFDGVAGQTASDACAVLRELLENVRKHAAASHVGVEVAASDDGGMAVLVEDDGAGMDPLVERRGHYGLQGIRERAASSGGDAVWGQSPLGGVRARVTLRGRAADESSAPLDGEVVR